MNRDGLDKTKSRSKALDGLRGVAALCVVFYHSILHNDLSLIERTLYIPVQKLSTARDVITKLSLVLFDGRLAVNLFFVLSGFVLALSLNEKREQSNLLLGSGFLVARAIRLYPPVIACMGIFLLVGLLHIPGYPVFTFEQFYLNASLLKISMHGPSGTIQGELLGAPFVLIAWLLRKTFGPIALVCSLAYSALALEAGALVFWLPNMHAYLIAFIIGMAVSEPAVSKFASDLRPCSLWIVLMLLYACQLFFPAASIVSLLVTLVLCAVLIAGLTYSTEGSMHRLLTSQPAQSLGRMSYSFYLLNVPVLYLIWALTDRWNWIRPISLEFGLVLGIISVAMTLPIAKLSQTLIERPSIKFARGVSAWLAKQLQPSEKSMNSTQGSAKV